MRTGDVKILWMPVVSVLLVLWLLWWWGCGPRWEVLTLMEGLKPAQEQAGSSFAIHTRDPPPCS